MLGGCSWDTGLQQSSGDGWAVRLLGALQEEGRWAEPSPSRGHSGAQEPLSWGFSVTERKVPQSCGEQAGLGNHVAPAGLPRLSPRHRVHLQRGRGWAVSGPRCIPLSSSTWCQQKLQVWQEGMQP